MVILMINTYIIYIFLKQKGTSVTNKKLIFFGEIGKKTKE